jgi:7,8-dihydroneopterin aldolase/epimerase/oxygenase
MLQARPMINTSEVINPDRLYLIIVRDLALSGRVGIHPHELTIAQPLRVNLEVCAARGGGGLGVMDYVAITEKVQETIEAGHVPLIEDLAEVLAANLLRDKRVRWVTVRLEKLTAVKNTAAVGVEITRSAG